jgi:hypothetical protein
MTLGFFIGASFGWTSPLFGGVVFVEMLRPKGSRLSNLPQRFRAPLRLEIALRIVRFKALKGG